MSWNGISLFCITKSCFSKSGILVSEASSFNFPSVLGFDLYLHFNVHFFLAHQITIIWMVFGFIFISYLSFLEVPPDCYNGLLVTTFSTYVKLKRKPKNQQMTPSSSSIFTGMIGTPLSKLNLTLSPFCFFSCFCLVCISVYLYSQQADIILWKGNDNTVLRLCACATQCNGLAFYCLPHTNLATEGMRWHLQGSVCERQPHMKEWPLKMIKEMTALSCWTLLIRPARCMFLRTYTHGCIGTFIHTLSLISISLWCILFKWFSVEMLPRALCSWCTHACW